MQDSLFVAGLAVLPLGILLMAAAALWQLYIMFSETYTLNRFAGKKLAGVIAALMFSFSLAVYIFCPNARKKGRIFLLLAGTGIVCYALGMKWLH